MNLIKLLFVNSLLVPLIQVSPQTFNEIIKNKNYMELLCTLSEDSNYLCLDNITKEQAKELARMAYIAYESNPVETYKFIGTKNQKWEEKIKKDKSKLNSVSVGMVEGKIWNLIKQKISVRTYELAKIPYFVKARIISKDTVQYEDKSTKFNYTKINIKAEVIESIKGKNRFNEGKEFEFYFFAYWEKPKEEYKINNTYLLPLEPRVEYDLNPKLIALVTYIDSPDVFFPVKNGLLLDKYNYFGFGDTNWDSFKKNFNDMIDKIKEEN
jgi:hypothetical protein